MPTNMNKAFSLTVESGQKYSWCSCGHSETMPLCDNSHREKSTKKSVKFIADESKTVLLCGCYKTQSPPFCDGKNNCKEC